VTRSLIIDRRRFIYRTSAVAGGLLLGGCDRLSNSPSFRTILNRAEGVTQGAQRLVLSAQPLAPEYADHDISKNFKANGSTEVDDPDYKKHASEGFVNWRLSVDGLVERPFGISLDELRGMPSRTQITRHDCVEGWSAIGKWKGTPLAAVLLRAGLKPDARYLVFHCADRLEPSAPYYESIDLIDAFHPQTILAYEMNDESLAVQHGAPVRLRVERQLGYKHAKYVMRIEAVTSLAGIGNGRGGYWEDRGYEWYAGI
jgi:DMSO/TMAO reductase YedYZ molybdopterin-dependent catalytic subunit